MAHDEKGEAHEGEHKHPHKKHHQHGAHAEHEHEEGWIVSFADNVLLMMGFFVILLAMNMKAPTTGGIGGVDGPHTPQPSKQWLDAVIAIREAFHSPIRLDSTDPAEAHLRQRLLERDRERRGESVIDGPEGTRNDLQGIRPDENYHVPTAVVRFETGSAELSESAAAKARADAQDAVGKLNIVVEVRGHVSAAEARRDNDAAWLLSYQRARTVAMLLIEQGIPAKNLRIVACGDAAPIKVRADTFGDHATNQRVEIILTQQQPELDQFADPGTADADTP